MLIQTKQKILLLTLVILLLLRFVVVPILDWQQQELLNIEAKSKQLAKAENVVEQTTEVLTELKALQQENAQLKTLYYSEASVNALKLQVQQQIEALFAKYNIKVKNFRWAAEISGDISEYRASIAYEGKTKDFAKLQLAIASLPKLLTITEWTLYIKKMKANNLGNVAGNLVIAVYNISSKVELVNGQN